MIPKFRAWHKHFKVMKKVGQITFTEAVWDYQPEQQNDTVGVSIPYQPDYVLMQSTGLHDVNGKEIFEGDILEIKDHPFQRHTGEMSDMPVGIHIDGRYVIEYNQENAGYVVGNWKTREVIHYCTVIGNVHEHPELLK